MTSVRSTSLSEARMVVERSTATAMSIAGEIEAWSCGSSAFTRSTVSMMLAPGCAVEDHQHRRLAVGEPGVADVLDRIDRPRRRRRGAPPRRCGRRRRGCGNRRPCAPGRCRRSGSGARRSSIAPLGLWALAAASAARTSSSPMPYLKSAVGIELDPHRRQRAAADIDLADAVDLREFLLQHGGRGVVDLAAAQRVRGQRQDQDRRVGRS